MTEKKEVFTILYNFCDIFLFLYILPLKRNSNKKYDSFLWPFGYFWLRGNRHNIDFSEHSFFLEHTIFPKSNKKRP